jgi:3-hydroxymyristoyl/3-hydroxydecanoyl-(acyl carrier protein) dehydratase
MVAPMPDLTLDAEGLKAYLPHRGANLIVDTVTMNADFTLAQSRTHVTPGDSRGRELFGRAGAGGVMCWYEPFLLELLALTGVALLKPRLTPDRVAAFSMASRVIFHRQAPLYGDILGHAQITRDRGGFTVFSSFAECEGQRLLDTEVMSGVVAIDRQGTGSIRPLVSAQVGHPADASLFAWKLPHLRFVDRVIESDATSGRLVASYHYPHDHPFVPGHFPDGALMMGMSQFAMAADAAWLARNAFGYTGGVMAQGTLKRQNGDEVLDIRDLQLTVEGGLPRIAGTRRLAFREPVRPGDGLLAEVTVKPA